MKSTKLTVRAIVDSFYHEHHDTERFENELVEAIKLARVQTFSEVKGRVIDALGTRAEQLVDQDPETGPRYSEIRFIKDFVRGMVIKND